MLLAGSGPVSIHLLSLTKEKEKESLREQNLLISQFHLTIKLFQQANRQQLLSLSTGIHYSYPSSEHISDINATMYVNWQDEFMAINMQRIRDHIHSPTLISLTMMYGKIIFLLSVFFSEIKKCTCYIVSYFIKYRLRKAICSEMHTTYVVVGIKFQG